MSQSEYKIQREQINYYWDGDKLMIRFAGLSVAYNDYQHQTWNRLATTENSTTTSAIEEYTKSISMNKDEAIKYGDGGIRIIEEITRLTTKQLELVKKFSKKAANGNNKQGDQLYVELDRETLTVVCRTCGCKPKRRMKCSRCCVAFYCDSNCQKLDWEKHKTICYR